MNRRFLYSLKLWDGRLLHVEGESPEEAARSAGVALHEIKRHMPVKKILTEEERSAQAQRLLDLRNRRTLPSENV